MSVTADIVATYRGPHKVLARHLAIGQREDRALTFLLLACILIFIAQAPGQARQAHLDETVPLTARLYWSGLFWIFILPLLMYALAAIGRLVSTMFGGSPSWFGARMALFWALLASSPLLLLQGLFAGLSLNVALSGMVGGLWFVVFMWFWSAGLRQAGKAVQ